MSRFRRFRYVAALLFLAALCAALFAFHAPSDSPVRVFERRYGMDVEAQNIPVFAKLTGEPCGDTQQAEALLAALDSALRRCPPSLSRAAKIRRVYLCESLTSFVTSVAGVTVLRDDAAELYLNAAFLSSPDYLARTIYHELFHALEFAHPFDDGAWRATNPHELYLEETTLKGQVVYYEESGAPPFEPGFVSEYARVRPREDRAELFAYLMSPRILTQEEIAMLSGDRYLAEKVACLRSYLESNFGKETFQWADCPIDVSTLKELPRYRAKKGAVLRTGPNDAYPKAEIEGALLYLGKYRTQDGDRLLILLDEKGQRVYAAEKSLIKEKE